MRPSRNLFRQAGAISALLLAGCALLGFDGVARGAESPVRWRWSNPKPHGGNVVDMAYSPSMVVAIQVAELGQIFSTSDFSVWAPRESGTSNDLRAVAFMGNRILITGQNGEVLYADTVSDFKRGTLSSGPTTDWLEGVAASASLAVAVGDNGAIYTSTNGIAWQRRASANQWLRSVAFGAGMFVAVGENGRIITSSNGGSWTTRASGTSENLNRVVFTSGKFTVLAENGISLASTNGGTSWFSEVTGAANDLFHALTAGTLRLVAGDSEVRSQVDGGGWKDELARAGGPIPWTYFSSTRTPDSSLIAGRTGLMEEAYGGTNGLPILWRSGDDSVRNWLWDVTYPTNLYVAVGDRATVMTSPNGVDWKLELVPEAATNSIFLGVGGTSSLLVAAGDNGSLIISPNTVTTTLITNVIGTNTVVSSNAFGILWHAPTRVTTNDLQGVGASTNLFVVTGAAGTILTSVDGTNWLTQPSATDRFLSSVTSWTGGWVATGDDGAILTSRDGQGWQLVPAITTNWLYRVRHLGGQLIAVGQNGVILTSPNGSSWTKQTSGTSKWLNDVVFIDGSWFVVGNSGTVLQSTNAIDWTSIGTLTRKHLFGAATDSRQLVAVGVEGAILRSPIVADTNAVRFLSYDRFSLEAGSEKIAQNLFLFGGRTDQQFTLDYRSAFDTNTWVTGPKLEFLDSSGTLFYLETLISSDPLPIEFYRATLDLP